MVNVATCTCICKCTMGPNNTHQLIITEFKGQVHLHTLLIATIAMHIVCMTQVITLHLVLKCKVLMCSEHMAYHNFSNGLNNFVVCKH